MLLTSSFAALGDGTLPETFEGLKSHICAEWIAEALATSGVATVRRRKLPAEQVVWLAVGIALYRDRPISEVVKRLELVLPGSDGGKRAISNGGIIGARNAVGYEPLENLFAITARHWSLESARRHTWRGLMVLGGDGTMMRVPDSGVNRETFGLPPSSRRSSGYPQIRAIGLMVLRSHLLLDFVFDSCKVGESELAASLTDKIPDQSVTILDRYFVNHLLWHKINSGGEQRHWLVRGKKNSRWTVKQHLGRWDDLVEIEYPRALRAQHPELPRSFLVRAVRYRRKGFRTRVLLTSLLDSVRYPATELAQLYHERWELELGYDEIKTDMLERLEAIRSQSPDRVRQEVWGLAVGYNLIRREMELAAAQWGVSPRRISFRGSLRLIRDLFVWAEIASPGALPKMLKGLRMDMKDLILPPRRSRRYRRHVKIKMSGYPRNDEHHA